MKNLSYKDFFIKLCPKNFYYSCVEIFKNNHYLGKDKIVIPYEIRMKAIECNINKKDSKRVNFYK